MSSPVFGVIAPHPPIFVPRCRRLEGRRHPRQSRCAGAGSGSALDLRSRDGRRHVAARSDAIRCVRRRRFSSFAGSLEQFGDPTPYGWTGDPALAGALASRTRIRGVEVVLRSSDTRLKAGWLDHATIVPLSFLEPTASRAIVVLSLSYLSYGKHRELGSALSAAADKIGRRVAFVASGDMSHRLTRDAPAGYSPRAADLDAAMCDLVTRGDLTGLMSIDPALVEAGGECGLRSFIALGGYAGPDPVPTRLLAYEGPWGVGYLTALVGRGALDAAEQRALGTTASSGLKGGTAGDDESQIVRSRARVIENHVSGRPDPHRPAFDDAEYPERAGAFVSLHRGGSLRGCIGTILPTRPDPRRGGRAQRHPGGRRPIRASRRCPPPSSRTSRSTWTCSMRPRAAPSTNSTPTRYGVIVTKGWRRGLLLPDLEGVDDVTTQVAIAMRKAGIAPTRAV